MKRILVELCSIFLVWLLVTGSLFGKEPTAEEIIANVRKKVEHVALIHARFLQTFFWSLAGDRQQSRGEIFLGPEDDFRIQTPEQIILSDGESVWTIDQVNKQVIIDKLDRSQDAFLPRQLFLRYRKEFQVSLHNVEPIDHKPCYHLVLIPKKQDQYLQKLEVWIDRETWLTRKVTYLDINENITSYLIEKIELLSRSKPELFRYHPQPDYEIVDMRE